jgi:hypothetical protein
MGSPVGVNAFDHFPGQILHPFSGQAIDDMAGVAAGVSRTGYEFALRIQPPRPLYASGWLQPMLPQVDFDSSFAVAEFVSAKFQALYPAADTALLQKIFADVGALFAGRRQGYAAIDLKYHNLRHTLMATACMALLLEGQKMAGGHLARRDFELAIAGVLLHDAGYVKATTDTAGTGAKYTSCHIQRSCSFASVYLSEIGATQSEIAEVLSAINCTGPNSEIGLQHFRDTASRMVGCSLATADYLAQLADPTYPEKLGDLFAEFRESDDFSGIPPEKRFFKSEEDMVCRTPGFWANFVKPKLEGDFQGVYRYLERPLGSGNNSYIKAVEENLGRISRRADAIRAARG